MAIAARELAPEPAHVQARNEVLLRYLPLVRHLAKRLASSYGLPPGVEVADLVSWGIVGLAEAFDRYDPSRGVKFETFAIPRVRGAILDGLREADWVPRNVRTRARKLSDAASTLTARLGRAPTREEIAASLGVEELDRFERRGTPATLLALDDVVTQGADGDAVPVSETLVDYGAPEPGSALEDEELRRRLLGALAELGERERLILTLYYFENVPLSEVARVLGVTESRVSQLHTRALHALREALG